MPIYTYHCDNCGVQFDRHQSFTDTPLTRCPECSKKALRKVFQPVGIVFKGSGFYATDHRSPSGTSRSGAGEKGEKSAETKKDGEKTAPAESTPSPQPSNQKD